MKKIFLYPLWKFDLVEKQLEEMENHGWRLVRIHPFCRFEFKQCKPRDSQYFFSCHMTREKLNMNIIGSSLLQDGATRIDGNCGGLLTNITYYRITNGTDLSQQRQLRNSFLSHFLLKETLTGLAAFLLTFVPFIIGFAQQNLLNSIFIVCWFVPVAMHTACNFAGFLYMRKKNKR